MIVGIRLEKKLHKRDRLKAINYICELIAFFFIITTR